MSSGEKQEDFGVLLKNLLEERSISMRKLSELTEIDTATISRIINGKRKANLQHLEKIADSLEVPLAELLTDRNIGREQGEEGSLSSFVEMIESFQRKSQVDEDYFSIERVEMKLRKYEQYAQTSDGKNFIVNNFEEKLRKVDSIGPFIDKFKMLYEKYQLEETESTKRLLIGSALIYFIMPIDVIPDYIFPIGYLDDAIAVMLVLKKLRGN